MTPATPSLRILCFGASITAGFHHFGLAFHPYLIRLKQRLQQSLSHTDIDIQLEALSGDCVVNGKYIGRLQSRLAKNAQKPFDWVIVQGGGNDLLAGRSHEQVYGELRSVWSIALSHGAKVLALTVTETGDRSKKTRSKYDALNHMIRQHRQVQYYVADVCSAIPWPNEEAEVQRIWDDGLHFTPVGYNMLGDAIADSIERVSPNWPLAKI